MSKVVSPWTDTEIIDRLIQREGGFADHRDDKGGPTRFGITKRTLSEWRGYDVSRAQVQTLHIDEAREIYARQYLEPFAAVTDGPLKELLVDTAVHSGPGKAKRLLQEALGVEVDGVIGLDTIGELAHADFVRVYRDVLRARLRFIGKILTRDVTQATFAAGWLNRIAEFII